MELQKLFNDLSAKAADLNAKFSQSLMDDTIGTDEIKKMKDELNDIKMRRDSVNELLKEEKDRKNNTDPKGNKDKVVQIKGTKDKLTKQKNALNNYIHTKKITDDLSGLTSTEAGVLIPEEITYQPEKQVNTVVDLKQYVNVVPVTTASGKYPVQAKITDTFASTTELAKNPELAAPKFTKVAWDVETYRGAIPISQEALDDSVVDLMPLVGQEIHDLSINTSNAKIVSVLKNFEAVSSTTDTLVDDIKEILNVKLDPGYSPIMLASQSLYNTLDTLKDKNGRYIFQPDITNPSQGALKGITVIRVNDDLLGKTGEKHAFIGDSKRGVLFADRKQTSVNWVDNDVYGQYLQGALRFDVEQADSKAGYMLTINDTAASTTK